MAELRTPNILCVEIPNTYNMTFWKLLETYNIILKFPV